MTSPDLDHENLADLLFGRIALRKAYLNLNQLDLAVHAQEETLRAGRRASLGEVCLREGFLPKEAVTEIIRAQEQELALEQDALFGTLAVRNEFVTPGDIDGAMSAQASEEEHLPIGEILLRQGLLTSQEHRALLTAQRRLLRLSYPGGADAFTLPSRPEGSRWVGSFYLVEELARGGMGVVFRAYDPVLDRDVALKLLPGPSYGERAERFAREIRTIRRLSHPHILPVHGEGRAEGQLFYTMDYLPGRTLAEAVQQNQVTHEDIPGLIRPVALALQYAHEQGVIHRDIKPANILLAENGGVFLSDFGLAKLPGEELNGGAPRTVGTLEYMSPEQARGAEDLDERADVYALGAVLYQMLCSRPPFEGGTAADLLHRIEHEEPAHLDEGLPANLRALAMKCLAKNPCERPATAAEFAEALGGSE